MRLTRLTVLSVTILWMLCSNSFADPWKFEVAPYLWAANMNGRTSIGPATVHINQSFSDILKHLNVGGMLYAAAHKDRFGIYFNGVYVNVSDGSHLSTNLGNINTHLNNRYSIVGAGISYIVVDKMFASGGQFTLEPYLGFRDTINNTSVKINKLSFKKNVSWTDPVVGIRLDYLFNKVWGILAQGDIGGVNASTQYSYSWGAFLHCRPSSWTHAQMYLGYRLLDQRYQTGSGRSFYDWNMKLFGPLLGLSFNF